MTETKKKALALVNAVSDAEITDIEADATFYDLYEALYLAIEQHEALRQEVSGSVQHYLDQWQNSTPSREVFACQFASFIIAKPDPLVEAMAEVTDANDANAADQLRAALAARGLKIVEVDHD